jgi:hypothetical protein
VTPFASSFSPSYDYDIKGFIDDEANHVNFCVVFFHFLCLRWTIGWDQHLFGPTIGHRTIIKNFPSTSNF